jgi:hypothetical protein
MRSPYCLCVCVPPKILKPGIVEPEEMAVSRQRLGTHFTAATNIHVTLTDPISSSQDFLF